CNDSIFVFKSTIRSSINLIVVNIELSKSFVLSVVLIFGFRRPKTLTGDDTDDDDDLRKKIDRNEINDQRQTNKNSNIGEKCDTFVYFGPLSNDFRSISKRLLSFIKRSRSCSNSSNLFTSGPSSQKLKTTIIINQKNTKAEKFAIFVIRPLNKPNKQQAAIFIQSAQKLIKK
ncbi:hypothetical protein DERP_007960, partial [Dermatophagoides pteronyssinus]